MYVVSAARTCIEHWTHSKTAPTKHTYTYILYLQSHFVCFSNLSFGSNEYLGSCPKWVDKWFLLQIIHLAQKKMEKNTLEIYKCHNFLCVKTAKSNFSSIKYLLWSIEFILSVVFWSFDSIITHNKWLRKGSVISVINKLNANTKYALSEDRKVALKWKITFKWSEWWHHHYRASDREKLDSNLSFTDDITFAVWCF